jgi:hypothetical protein
MNLKEFLAAKKVGAAGRKLELGFAAGCEGRKSVDDQGQRDFHVASILP